MSGVQALMYSLHEPTTKTKSAARLAAEAAFAPPRQTSEPLSVKGLPEITFLRAKRVAAVAGCADSDPDSDPGADPRADDRADPDETTWTEPQLHAPKVPRVFLVKSEDVESASTAPEPSAFREVQAQAADVPMGRGGGVSTPAPRARRSRSKAPPVTWVFSAVAGEGAAAVACDEVPELPSRTQGDLPGHNAVSLAAALAEIDPTFAAISAAMCFRVDDPQVPAQWERLSKALDQLSAEIKASLAPGRPGRLAADRLLPRTEHAHRC